MNSELFKDMTYGMYVVSSCDENKRVGCIINTATQITSNDPLISISLNKENYTNKVIKKTKRLALMILSEDASKEVISTFGYQSSKEEEKFKEGEYEIKENLPILKKGICGYMIAEVNKVLDCGTHDLFLCLIKKAEKVSKSFPMSYAYYHEVLKGASPKKAPTFIEEKRESDKPVYQCIICGHIYDDSKEPIAFEKLPDSWVCPTCKVGKRMFKRIDET